MYFERYFRTQKLRLSSQRSGSALRVLLSSRATLVPCKFALRIRTVPQRERDTHVPRRGFTEYSANPRGATARAHALRRLARRRLGTAPQRERFDTREAVRAAVPFEPLARTRGEPATNLQRALNRGSPITFFFVSFFVLLVYFLILFVCFFLQKFTNLTSVDAQKRMYVTITPLRLCCSQAPGATLEHIGP